MSHEKSAVHFDEIGQIIAVGAKRLRLSKTQFKIMAMIHGNHMTGKKTSAAEIKKLLRPGASDKSVHQNMYTLRKLFNNVKHFPLRLYYVRRNRDKWYEIEVKR